MPSSHPDIDGANEIWLNQALHQGLLHELRCTLDPNRRSQIGIFEDVLDYLIKFAYDLG